jgi:hypothetical protein
MNDCKLIVKLAKQCNIENFSNIKKETRDKITSINSNLQETVGQKDQRILRGKLDKLVKLSIDYATKVVSHHTSPKQAMRLISLISKY